MNQTPANAPQKPAWAFIAAAGMGSRMRPLTDTRPKPMIEVCGVPILKHIFDHLQAAGITDIVLNTHHKHEVIEDWIASGGAGSGLDITLIHEPDLLDTGGGVQNAVTQLGRGDAPIVMINGDAFWVDAASERTLDAMMAQWDGDTMDMLLLLQPVGRMALTEGRGDYRMDAQGRPQRLADRSGDLMFAGVRIFHPRILKDRAPGKYSFLELMDAVEKDGRLAGTVHKGDWHHLSTPQDVTSVNAALGPGWRVPRHGTARR